MKHIKITLKSKLLVAKTEIAKGLQCCAKIMRKL